MQKEKFAIKVDTKKKQVMNMLWYKMCIPLNRLI